MAEQEHHRRFGIGGLGQRLILAFVGVALATLATEVAIDTFTAGAEIENFVDVQQADLTNAVAQAAAASYVSDSRWHSARLQPVINLVMGTKVAVRVRGPSGQVVAVSPGFARVPRDPQLEAPVVVRGKQVGQVTLKFGHNGLSGAGASLAAARWREHFYAAGIAVLLALVVSVVAARWITSPLERILVAMRARGAGDRNVRITNVHAVGVLGDLLETFNATATIVDRRERAQRNLIADVTHELRTRVAVLQAGHEALLDGIIEPVPENLGSMRDEVLRLSRLLEDLQVLAAAEAAAMQLRVASHDLADVASATASSLADGFDMAELTLETHLSPSTVMCDYDRMQEIITNLLTNAMKYTPAGGRVVLETGPEEPKQARLRVSDTGVGIPPDELPGVTERFFRGRRTSDMATGSGLGLAIAAELVRAHHGELDIASEPGSGTQVTITLPRVAGHDCW